MGIIDKDFKYKKIKNFLTKKELALLGGYAELYHRHNNTEFEEGQSNVNDTVAYGDKLMDTLLCVKKKYLEKIVGKKLLPTYSYFRVYTKYAHLKKHTDRPSCEISVTINVASCGVKWPIFMDGTPIDLKPGEAAVYLGQKVKHERKEFLGDFQSQVFLHYVDANGPHKEYYRDKRNLFGEKKI
jgi:hypothetical protein|tara:strand:- start:323 stop:874 length:552 start_codon:yes stop_codon:yes gene_type:complete